MTFKTTKLSNKLYIQFHFRLTSRKASISSNLIPPLYYVLFHLLSASSPPDVISEFHPQMVGSLSACWFALFKRQSTTVLTSFPVSTDCAGKAFFEREYRLQKFSGMIAAVEWERGDEYTSLSITGWYLGFWGGDRKIIMLEGVYSD